MQQSLSICNHLAAGPHVQLLSELLVDQHFKRLVAHTRAPITAPLHRWLCSLHALEGRLLLKRMVQSFNVSLLAASSLLQRHSRWTQRYVCQGFHLPGAHMVSAEHFECGTPTAEHAPDPRMTQDQWVTAQDLKGHKFRVHYDKLAICTGSQVRTLCQHPLAQNGPPS